MNCGRRSSSTEPPKNPFGMGRPRVHNKMKGTAPPGYVYVGRGSPWGNPFKEGTREENIARFKEETLPGLDLRPLIGRHLVCWCKPKPCHGDLLLEAARKLEESSK